MLSTQSDSRAPEIDEGTVNEFADRRLITNVSAFWYHYKDQQAQSVQEVEDTGVEGAVAASSVRFNAASSRILGLEADATARLPLGLSLNLAMMLLDARFTAGQVADTRVGYGASDQPIVDLEGNRLRFFNPPRQFGVRLTVTL